MQAIPIITIEAAGELMNALQDYLDKSEASFALVIDRGGAILSQHGKLPEGSDMTVLAALAAGSYAATRELAARVGEADFSSLHQEGLKMQLLMSAVDEDVVLVTGFGPQTTLGLVRFYAARAVPQVAGIIAKARAAQRPTEPIFTTADVAAAFRR
jgi:predicted regulator of Ras-like GTPase activity (Roadblock/LC7/MglB family)